MLKVESPPHPWKFHSRRLSEDATGVEKEGEENLTKDTPPKKGFWTPLRLVRFHPRQVSLPCFSCERIHDRADQQLSWRGPETFGRMRSLVRFPPPVRFAPPYIMAQVFACGSSTWEVPSRHGKCRLGRTARWKVSF